MMLRTLIQWVLVAYMQCRLLLADMPVKVPPREPGTHYSPHSLGALVKLEVFLDLNCPDSLKAWPEIKRTAQHYGTDNVDIIVHQYPLPFHSYAHLASQGFYLMRDFLGEEAAFDYLNTVLSKYYLFTDATSQTYNKTRIKHILAEQASSVTSISSDQFVSYIDHYWSETVQAWKFGARRGVAGTPWYFINGIDLTRSKSMSFQELRRTIDSLIGVSYV